MRHNYERERRIAYTLIGTGLPALSVFFLWLEHVTHFEFLLHLAAIPLEILLGAFLVERWLARKEKEGKRRQLMYLKSYLFRSEMRSVFISNFGALERPAIRLEWVREAPPAELIRCRDGIATLEYLLSLLVVASMLLAACGGAKKNPLLVKNWQSALCSRPKMNPAGSRMKPASPKP